MKRAAHAGQLPSELWRWMGFLKDFPNTDLTSDPASVVSSSRHSLLLRHGSGTYLIVTIPTLYQMWLCSGYSALANLSLDPEKCMHSH